MRWIQKLVDFNFKIMYCSDKQNIKVDALTRQVDLVSRSSEDEHVRYQWITILTSNWMKIADLEKNISESIYKQILDKWNRQELYVTSRSNSKRQDTIWRYQIKKLLSSERNTISRWSSMNFLQWASSNEVNSESSWSIFYWSFWNSQNDEDHKKILLLIFNVKDNKSIYLKLLHLSAIKDFSR